jgi:small subunit ribosomal protein S6
MPDTKRAYDLFVLIDPDVPDERRTGMVDEIRKRISAGEGELKGDVEWGTRRLAYEINHRSDAYYHLFQFEGSAGLLETLNRTLAIEDGILRHRILRLPKGAPDEPPKPPPASRQPEPTREGRHGRRHATSPSAEESAPEERGSDTSAAAPEDSAPAAAAPEDSAPGAAPEDSAPAAAPEDSAPAAADSAATTSTPAPDEAETPDSSGSES